LANQLSEYDDCENEMLELRCRDGEPQYVVGQEAALVYRPDYGDRFSADG
jgi:hypothetical protein